MKPSRSRSKASKSKVTLVQKKTDSCVADTILPNQSSAFPHCYHSDVGYDEPFECKMAYPLDTNDGCRYSAIASQKVSENNLEKFEVAPVYREQEDVPVILPVSSKQSKKARARNKKKSKSKIKQNEDRKLGMGDGNKRNANERDERACLSTLKTSAEAYHGENGSSQGVISAPLASQEGTCRHMHMCSSYSPYNIPRH